MFTGSKNLSARLVDDPQLSPWQPRMWQSWSPVSLPPSLPPAPQFRFLPAAPGPPGLSVSPLDVPVTSQPRPGYWTSAGAQVAANGAGLSPGCILISQAWHGCEDDDGVVSCRVLGESAFLSPSSWQRYRPIVTRRVNYKRIHFSSELTKFFSYSSRSLFQ